MDTIKLEVVKRGDDLSVKQIRDQKMVPAVYYGKGEDSVPLQIEYQAMRKTFLQAGYSSLVDLTIDGKVKKVLIQEVQLHPLKGTIQHVDFMHVNLKEEITTEVPVVIVGVAPAVKDFGGTLNTVKNEVEVKCLPTDIPHEIEVDISGLVELSAAIHVSDIKVPKGVVILDDPENVVVMVNAPRVEEEETSVEAGVAEGAEGEKPAEGGEEGDKKEDEKSE